ncbi:MAG: hypothetical protein ACRDD2_12130 [Sarcina sp.]
MARFKIYMDSKNKKLKTVDTPYGEIEPKKLTIDNQRVEIKSLGRILPKKKMQFIDIKTNTFIPYSKLKNGEYEFYQITANRKYMFWALIAFCIITPLLSLTVKSIPKETLSNGSIVIFVIILLILNRFEVSKARKILKELSDSLK